MIRICGSITTDTIVLNHSLMTVSPDSLTFGTVQSGQLTGNPFSGKLTLWTPAIVISRGNMTVFNRFGAEGSYTQTTAHRWQETVSTVNGNVTSNTRINLAVGFNPKHFYATAIGVQIIGGIFAGGIAIFGPAAVLSGAGAAAQGAQ